MFTGIVEAVGEVARAERSDGLLRLSITEPGIAGGLRVGDSVSVNGVCLTATDVVDGSFAVEAMKETLDRTTIGSLDAGSPVNLELAARLQDRLGGHLVQGHVDGTAVVDEVRTGEGEVVLHLSADRDVLRYLVPKGSVAIDGVSLTVVDVTVSGFSVALIPHTLQATTLGSLSAGARVNVEVDVVAKYVERFVTQGRN